MFHFPFQESFSKEKERLLSAHASTERSTDDPDTAVSLPPDSQIWKQIVGEKKGRVYGMGSQAHTMWSAVHDTGSSSSSQGQIYEIRKEVRALQESVNFLILQFGARQPSPMQQPPMPYAPWIPPMPSQMPTPPTQMAPMPSQMPPPPS